MRKLELMELTSSSYHHYHFWIRILTEATTTNRADVNCYDNGWDIDISDFSIGDHINNFCENELSEGGSAFYIPFEQKRSDGTSFPINLTAMKQIDAETCKSNFFQIIWTCISNESDGDLTHFKGGSIVETDGDRSLSIDKI